MPKNNYVKQIENKKQFQKKYWKTYNRRSQKKYKSESYYKDKSFICFDGETENNRYTLLGNSKSYIYDKKGLTTNQMLNFLWTQGQGKIKVVFAIHFDVQFWINDLSDNKILDLLNGEEVRAGKFDLLYIPKRFLKLSKGKAQIYIYDISSFFQSSLLYTIEKMKINLSSSEKKILFQGKKKRSKNFSGMKKSDIILYNKTECIITEKICDKLQSLLKSVIFENKNGDKFNLIPKRFYGSGAIAKKILTELNLKPLAEAEKNLNDQIKEMIYKSYFGGRAEIFKLGTFRNLYKYDINSAYPSFLRLLRVPKSFKVYKINKTFRKFDFVDENIYFIETDFSISHSNLIGVLPYRMKSGYVIYPKRVKGYYFGIEAKYLNELCKLTAGNFTIYKCLEINYKDEKVFPENFIEDIYKKRLELKKKNDVSEIVYKLGLNSLYGKLAQQTGNNEFTVILFASYVTASTRSLILKTIFENNLISSLLQISTDAIFTTRKIQKILINNQLGNYSENYYHSGVILGSGVYSLKGKTKKEFSLRGFEVSEKNFNEIYKHVLKNETAQIKYKSFIGHKLALIQKNAFGKERLKFTEIIKTISPFEYKKRIFLKRNKINKVSISHWFDIFDKGEIVTESNLLKKFEADLFDEIIDL